MSLREAAKQTSSEAAPHVTSDWRLTGAEREAATEGIRAGWKLRQREAALNVVATGDALATAGRAADYTMPRDFWPLDKDTGDRVPIDAHDVLDEAEAVAKQRQQDRPEAGRILARLRLIRDERPLTDDEQDALAGALDTLTARVSVGRYVTTDGARMTPRDLARLAGYARRCAERMARPRLTEAEAEDVEQDALAAILARGQRRPACAVCGAPSDGYTDATDASPRLPRCYRCAGSTCGAWHPHPHGKLPRWDALTPADLDGADERPADGRESGASSARMDALRGQWRGFSYLEARAAIRRRHERLTVEQGADWTPTGESDAPTPEQRAALAADERSSALLEDLDTGAVVHGVYALSATAGAPLTAPERDALALSLSGWTRAQLATARGVSTDAIKQGGKRGRASLAKRTPERADAQRWAQDAQRRLANLTRPDERSEAARVLAERLDVYRGARQSWPPREAPCDGGDTGHLPAPIVGAGTRANVPVTSAIGCAQWAPVPRRTRSGAPRVARPAPLAPWHVRALAAHALATAPAPTDITGAVPLLDTRQQDERDRLAAGRQRARDAAGWRLYKLAQREAVRAQARRNERHLGRPDVLLYA